MSFGSSFTITTMADLFNLVSVDNFQRLTDDLIQALHFYAEIKNDMEVDSLPKDWSLLWTDDGEVKTTFRVRYG